MNGLSLREIKTRKSNDRYANVLEFVRRDALKNDDDTPTRKNVPRAEPLRKRLELNPPRRAFTAHSRPTPSRLSSRYVSRRIIDPEKRKDRSKIFQITIYIRRLNPAVDPPARLPDPYRRPREIGASKSFFLDVVRPRIDRDRSRPTINHDVPS
jgi:hypothetical protein